MKNYISMMPVNLVEKIKLLKLKREEVQAKINKPFNMLSCLFMGSFVTVFMFIMSESFFQINISTMLYKIATTGFLASVILILFLACFELLIKRYYNKVLGYDYLANEVKKYLKSSITQKEIITYFNQITLNHPLLSHNNDLFKIALTEENYSEALIQIELMIKQIEKIDESSEKIEVNKLKILELEKSLNILDEKEIEVGMQLKKYL